MYRAQHKRLQERQPLHGAKRGRRGGVKPPLQRRRAQNPTGDGGVWGTRRSLPERTKTTTTQENDDQEEDRSLRDQGCGTDEEYVLRWAG